MNNSSEETENSALLEQRVVSEIEKGIKLKKRKRFAASSPGSVVQVHRLPPKELPDSSKDRREVFSRQVVQIWASSLCTYCLLLLIAYLIWYVRYREFRSYDPETWMYEVGIINVMGYFAIGDQRPMQRSWKDFPYHIYGQRTKQIMQNIKKGDVITLLQGTVGEALSYITKDTPDFSLISVNGDAPFDPKLQQRICKYPQIKAVFAQNLMISDVDCNNRIFPLPLGLSMHYNLPYHPLGIEEYYFILRKLQVLQQKPKLPRIMIPYMQMHTQHAQGSSGKSRKQFVDEFLDMPQVDVFEKMDYFEMLSTMAEYAFVLSPLGNGYDCFRTWEIFAMGSIPIVVNDEAFNMGVHDGVDVWIVNGAEEVKANFENKYASIKLIDDDMMPDVMNLTFWKTIFQQSAAS